MPADSPSKVTAAHLRREAYLYVRQSTIKQVLNNTESALRQYDLKSRAIALGWSAEQVIVIDIDQGQSGASAADREGFQRLVAEVGMGRAGIVLGLECSRLARNNADWHRLLEICGLSGTLICDEDGLYDPTDFNDRMLLGMKGQLSEAELHFLRSRLRGHPEQGPPRRADHPAAGRPGLRRARQGRPRPRPSRPTRHHPPVRHLRRHRIRARGPQGIQQRRTAVSPPPPQRPPQRRTGLGAADPLRRPARPAQPPLRRRVQLRPDPPDPRPRPQDPHPAGHRPPRTDRLHPRRPSRLHHPSPPSTPTRPGWPNAPPHAEPTAKPARPAKDPPCCKASSSAADADDA